MFSFRGSQLKPMLGLCGIKVRRDKSLHYFIHQHSLVSGRRTFERAFIRSCPGYRPQRTTRTDATPRRSALILCMRCTNTTSSGMTTDETLYQWRAESPRRLKLISRYNLRAPTRFELPLDVPGRHPATSPHQPHPHPSCLQGPHGPVDKSVWRRPPPPFPVLQHRRSQPGYRDQSGEPCAS